MARLNATPAKPIERRLTRKERDTTARQASSRVKSHSAETERDKEEQWTMKGETWAKDRPTRNADKPALGKTRSKRSGTVSSGIFDILPDGDRISESEISREGHGNRTKTTIALKQAHVNSLPIPLSQQQQSQQSRNRLTLKLETYDYDKENDFIDDEAEEDNDNSSSLSRNSSNASRQSTTRRNTQQTPERNRSDPQFMDHRQQEIRSEDEGNNDNSFSSLDDFIVSDNDEISYHETSDNETSEEDTPEKKFSPPGSRRRLIRGRRPDPVAELKKALVHSSHQGDFHLEPSLPTAMILPSPKRLFHNDLNISEKMNHLDLENNDPASQLQNELYEIAADSGSPLNESAPEPAVMGTPPHSPTRRFLPSPTKQKVQMPPTPYRESVDAFWSQEITNDWVDQHSPRKGARKVERLLQEFEESDNDTDLGLMPKSRPVQEPKTPSKTALKKAETEKKKAALARKKSFDDKKGSVAEDFFKVLDNAVSGGQVQKLAEATGGVKITWSKTLQTTAGRASWKREKLKLEPQTPGSQPQPSKLIKQHASIELAERIIDSENRLINTLAHEYCHLANFMISNVHNNPHGASFKEWGRKCTEALKDHPVYGGMVEVTTKHSYQIDYKYVWNCVDCGQSYGRHSKSIDTTKSRCGKCKGLLQQIKPKPRNVSPRKKQLSHSADGFGENAVEDMVKDLGEVSLYS